MLNLVGNGADDEQENGISEYEGVGDQVHRPLVVFSGDEDVERVDDEADVGVADADQQGHSKVLVELSDEVAHQHVLALPFLQIQHQLGLNVLGLDIDATPGKKLR